MGQTWVIVSTLISPRVKSCRRDNADGYIILADDKGNRIVAVGLGFTNECVDYPNVKWLYVNATFQKRLRRFDVSEQDALSNKSKVVELGVGRTFVDGLTFDVEGGVWITNIVSNRVIRITPDGE
jgi:sugar lactone lactonase YvrE